MLLASVCITIKIGQQATIPGHREIIVILSYPKNQTKNEYRISYGSSLYHFSLHHTNQIKPLGERNSLNNLRILWTLLMESLLLIQRGKNYMIYHQERKKKKSHNINCTSLRQVVDYSTPFSFQPTPPTYLYLSSPQLVMRRPACGCGHLLPCNFKSQNSLTLRISTEKSKEKENWSR